MQVGHPGRLRAAFNGLAMDAMCVSDELSELLSGFRGEQDEEDLLIADGLRSHWEVTRMVELQLTEREHEERAERIVRGLFSAAREAMTQVECSRHWPEIELAMTGALRTLVDDHQQKKTALAATRTA